MRTILVAALLLLAASRNAFSEPWGGPLRLNTSTVSFQAYPSAAGISTAEFVVVWSGIQAIRGQRVNMVSGQPSGAEFIVTAGGFPENPVVATDIAGIFVVAWDADSDGQYTGIRARRFNFSGEPLGDPFYANSDIAGSQFSGQVASFGSRRFVVVWSDAPSLVGVRDIEGRLIASSGAPEGSEFRINTVTTASQNNPDVAGAHNQGFVVVWSDQTGGDDITAQRYNPQGQPVASSFRVNEYTTGTQNGPRVASDSQGNFVVIYQDHTRDGNSLGVFGRRFNAAGSPLGPEFRVNTTTTGSQLTPAVAMDFNGSFLVAWKANDASGSGIFAQEFEPGGTPRGPEMRVNTQEEGTQERPEVATGYLNFVVTWEGPDGAEHGVFAQRFCYKGDVDGNGTRNVADVLYMINRLFAAGPPPATYCPSVNGDDVLNVSDVLYLINHLFAGGPAPV